MLENAPDGRSCRFLIRSRGESRPLVRFALSLVLDPIHFLMQRRMMLAIKELAEAKTAADRHMIPAVSDYAWFFSILGAGLVLEIGVDALIVPDLPRSGTKSLLVIQDDHTIDLLQSLASVTYTAAGFAGNPF